VRVAPKFCLEIRGVRKATIENKQKQNANYFKENKNGAMPKKKGCDFAWQFYYAQYSGSKLIQI